MRPVPKWLPPGDSRKWHSRRWWDQLGYIRVRTLANPDWGRNVPWLLHILDVSRPRQPGTERDVFDRAVKDLRRYRDSKGSEAQWDAFLDSLDAYLLLVHEDHIRRVKEAGKSVV